MANRYIKQGGSGSTTGTGTLGNWSNAMPDFPATLVRGDTYYVAGGTYGSHTFASLSGTTYVFIKKATVADHGTGDADGVNGWLDTMGTAQAVFSSTSQVFTINMTNLSIDGVTGDWDAARTVLSGHGIKLVTTGTTQPGGATIYSGNNAPNGLILRRLECAAPAPNGNLQNFNIDSHVFPGANGTTISYCYIHGGLVGWLSTGSNELMEHCWLKDIGGQQHCEMIDAANSQNLTIRYNVLENLVCCNGTTYIEPQVNGGTVPNGIFVYGNVFKATRADEGTNNPSMFSSTSNEQVLNVHIYNNTIYGLHGCTPQVGFADTGIRGDNAGSVITCRNNIWQACVRDPGFQAVQTQTNNMLNTGGANFVNALAGDLRLASNTVAGFTLASPYNVDAYGTTRGSSVAWSLGAYQFATAGPDVTAPSAPTNLSVV